MGLPTTRNALSRYNYDVSNSRNGSDYINYRLYDSEEEQNLSETLYDECCQKYGLEVLWVRREFVNIDGIIGEDRYSLFSGENAFPLKLYALDFHNYNSDAFFAKTQITYPDKVRFHMTKNRFAAETERHFGRAVEPQIGDIFLINITNDIWVVNFNEPEAQYYERGRAYVWEFDCTRYIHSGENFETGNNELDFVVSVDDFDLNPPDKVTGDNTRIDELEELNDIIDEDEIDIYGGL